MSIESRKSLRKVKLLFAGALVLCCGVIELEKRRWIFAGILFAAGIFLLLFPWMFLRYRPHGATQCGGLRLKSPVLAIGLLCCVAVIIAIMFYLK